MGIAIPIVVLTIVGLLIGIAFNVAAPIIAIPILFIAINLIVGKEVLERQQHLRSVRRFRRDARAQKTKFTAGDKDTLAR
jgi:hypothetical protein